MFPPGAWYHDAVIWAAENGIVSGVGGGMFAPGRPISRQEMAVMLYNYASFKGYGIPANRVLPGFTDYALIASWAETAARALAEAGVINGSNNEFKPLNDATRAEVAQMFKNFMRLVADEAATQGAQPLAAANAASRTDAYIDRSAMEAIERVLLAAADTENE